MRRKSVIDLRTHLASMLPTSLALGEVGRAVLCAPPTAVKPPVFQACGCSSVAGRFSLSRRERTGVRGNKPFACPSRNELQLVLRSKRAPGLLALSIVLHFAPLRTPTLAIAAENPPPYRWVQVAAKAPFAPRDGAGAFVFDGKMWLAGGWNPADKQAFPRTCSNDVWYSADGVIWTQLPDTPWKPRHAASVFVHDNALWLVAGSNMESDVWKLVRTSAKP